MDNKVSVVDVFQKIANGYGLSEENLREIYWNIIAKRDDHIFLNPAHPDIIEGSIKLSFGKKLDMDFKEFFAIHEKDFQSARKNTLVGIALEKNPEIYDNQFKSDPYHTLGKGGAYTPHVSSTTRWPGFEFREKVLRQIGVKSKSRFGDAPESFDGTVITPENVDIVSEAMKKGDMDFSGCIITNGGAVLVYDVGGIYAGPLMSGKINAGYRFADKEFADNIQIFLIESAETELINILEKLAQGIVAIAERNKGVVVHLEDMKGIYLMGIALPIFENIHSRIYTFSDDQIYTGLMAVAPLSIFLSEIGITSNTIGDKIGIINGFGAAGHGVAEALKQVGLDYMPIVCCDSKGIIHRKRRDYQALPKFKRDYALDLEKYGISDIDGKNVYLQDFSDKIDPDKVLFFYEVSGNGRYFSKNPYLFSHLAKRNSPIFFGLMGNPARESADVMGQILKYFGENKTIGYLGMVTGSPPELIYDDIPDSYNVEISYSEFYEKVKVSQANNIVFFPSTASTIWRIVKAGYINCMNKDEVNSAHKAAYDGLVNISPELRKDQLLPSLDYLLVPGG
ncbi:MAG: malic enzyme-like NAD(P)-binding protein, partial [Candidatus Poribacteria bacterium]